MLSLEIHRSGVTYRWKSDGVRVKAAVIQSLESIVNQILDKQKTTQLLLYIEIVISSGVLNIQRNRDEKRIRPMGFDSEDTLDLRTAISWQTISRTASSSSGLSVDLRTLRKVSLETG